MLGFINALGLISLLLGAALILTGRKLFWLFVGAIGFGVGLQFAERFLQGPNVPGLLIGLVVGIIFALLAIFLQTVAIGAAGFFGGGYVLLGLVTAAGLDRGLLVWIAFLVGGILGVVLIGYLFDWALITLSSMAGASMIVNALELGRGLGGAILIALVIVGVVVQGALLRREKSPEAPND